MKSSNLRPPGALRRVALLLPFLLLPASARATSPRASSRLGGAATRPRRVALAPGDSSLVAGRVLGRDAAARPCGPSGDLEGLCFEGAAYFPDVAKGVAQTFVDARGRRFSVAPERLASAGAGGERWIRTSGPEAWAEVLRRDGDDLWFYQLRFSRTPADPPGYEELPLVLGGTLVRGDRYQRVGRSGRTPGTGNPIRVQLDVVGTQRVEVPAGTFPRALRLELRWFDARTDALFAEETWWLGRGVGMVRRDGDGPGGRFHYRLVEVEGLPPGAGPVDPEGLRVAEYLPLDLGRRWTYRDRTAPGRTFTRVVDEHREHRGHAVASVRNLDCYGEVAYWTRRDGRRLVYRHHPRRGVMDLHDDPPALATGPTVRVGEAFAAAPRAYTDPRTGGHLRVESTVLGLESLAVAAGEFDDVLRIHVEAFDSATGRIHSWFDLWFARGVGLIRRRGRVADEEVDEELAAYQAR